MPTDNSGRTRGLALSAAYFHEAVAPLIAAAFPGLAYAAALIGPGSEVLGFDDDRSRDHDWGLRLQIFVEDAAAIAEIDALLADRLPERFRDRPVRFSLRSSPVRHQVEVSTAADWFEAWLGFDPRGDITLFDWLGTPAFRLAEIAGGAVFADTAGTLGRFRSKLAWYPEPVWYWILASQWRRLEQEEPFAGRTAEAGDALGSAVIAARLARDLMILWLFMHRVYPPYGKWLGSAFARLPGTAPVRSALAAAIGASGWPAREAALAAAFEATAREHNRLGLTEFVSPEIGFFHDRPYRVLNCGRFTAALTARIADPALAAVPPVGSVSQHLDSTDANARPELTRALAARILALRG